MENSKSTKRAWLTSALSVLACVAMLIGTTFAWFTDTAKTNVNKIQSGTLDVALEMLTKNEAGEDVWVNAENQTLDFKKAEGGAGEKILWEPGCTYELPKLRVVNNGNLALKYKVQITGIKGDAELNKVIDWTIGCRRHPMSSPSKVICRKPPETPIRTNPSTASPSRLSQRRILWSTTATVTSMIRMRSIRWL